jgi:TonB family protein
MNALLVTAQVGSASRRWLWNPSQPIGVGHPFRWILERTAEGVRVRDLSSRRGEILADSFREVSDEAIRLGRGEIQLASVTFKFAPARALPAAFAQEFGAEIEAANEGYFNIYSTVGDWITGGARVEKTPAYHGYIPGSHGQRKLFSIERLGRRAYDSFKLRAEQPGLKWSVGGEAPRELAPGTELQVTPAQLAHAQLTLGSHGWHFARASAPEFTPAATVENPATARENREFRRQLGYAGGAVALLMAFAFVSQYLLPKGNEAEEVIPAQYAKIVLEKTKGSPEASGAESAAPQAAEQVAQNAPKKVQNAAVVQAFRAKALQNAVSGLLKGGMTKLLAQSDFVSGRAATSEARRAMDMQSEALKPSGDGMGRIGEKSVAVASLGGEGAGGQGGTGGANAVGYGKGHHAGVKGQGNGFVSMDIGGAAVEDGLTKDQVGEVIHKHLSEVRYCYESAMIRQPDIEGKLVVNFTIGGSGMVKVSEVKTSTLPDPRLDDCILRRLNTWKFPNPKGGIDVAVTYPFIFKTLGR